MGVGQDAFKSDLNSLGLNVMWDVNDNLRLVFDYHDSTSERGPNSPFGDSALVSMAAYTRNVTTLYTGQELPILELKLGNLLTADDMQTTGSVFAQRFSKMDIEQFRVAGSYQFYDSDFIETIDFGIEMGEVNNRSAFSRVQRDAWGGQWVSPVGAIADLLTPASMAGAFSEIPGGNDARLQTDYFTVDMGQLITRMESLMASGDLAIFPAVEDMGDCGTGLCTSSNFSDDKRTQEESTAVYIQANMATEFGDMPVAMRFGIRHEETDVSSQALSPTYTGINWIAGNELALVPSGQQDFTSFQGSYDVTLPNFDFKIDITDDLVGRFSASKAITRPGYNDIAGGLTLATTVRVNGGTGNRGNPGLLPFESFNLDFSLEYYYGDGSYVAVGYFDKEVDNFIGTDNIVETPFNLPHPALGPLQDAATAAGQGAGASFAWILANLAGEPGVDAVNQQISGVAGRDPASPFGITVPVNQENAQFDGWELVVQHNFWDSGFGVIANYTMVDSDLAYDTSKGQFEEQFVLPGLSDSANLVLFYDRDGINVRLAYNWRDDFLAGIGQGQQFQGAKNPTFTAEYEQWDISASYWVNDNFQVFLDAINITDETTHVYGRDKQQTLFAAQLGPRYNLGVRYKF